MQLLTRISATNKTKSATRHENIPDLAPFRRIWYAFAVIILGCYVNGMLQNQGAGATITSGWICLQSEGSPIEFRDIYIEPARK